MREGQIILFNTKTVNLILFILVNLVIIYSELYNPQVTNTQAIKYLINFNPSMLVGTSETVCMLSICLKLGKDDLKLRQWIAGVIDGDGNFNISKKGYIELSVVMEPRDIACLSKLKNRYGGSVKATSQAKAVRFRLHHKAGILQVIKDINGLIQNPVRLIQFKKICDLYSITVLPKVKLEYLSGYLSGLFDSDGSIYYNYTSNQVFLTVAQKHSYLLELLASIYGGKVYSANAGKTAFK
jgi:hypothetical protein